MHRLPRPGAGESSALSGDAERVEEVARALAASVNVRLLALLAAERRKRGEDGWLHLSDIAERLDEAPGTVGSAVGRLLVAGLVQEKREKGKRYFLATMTDLAIHLTR